ncbi:MAG: ABC transporter ATP-binding protein/permease [Candidatus Cloacimonetes bacterium]|nr:ABC transporter ATP-binding protein/permease [Candidatus Cloacimonadota bacterium]
MRRYLNWILKEWKQQKSFIFIMVLLTMVSAMVSIAYPYMFKIIIDKLKELTDNADRYAEPMKEIYRILWLLLAIGVGQLIAGIYPAIRAMVNYRFEFALRTRYFRYISEKDCLFFNKFRTGDLVTRLTNDISDFPKIGWFLCSGIFRAFNSFVSIVFMLFAMFKLNSLLTWYSLVPIPVMLLVFYFVNKTLGERYQRNQQAISRINDQLELSFSAIRIIKAFACEDKYNRFFDQALEQRRQTEIKLIQLNATMMLIWEYISYFAQISIIVFGGMMAVKGTISIGTFMAFYSYLGMMIYPLLDLPQLFVAGRQAFVNIDRLEEIKDFPTTLNRFQGQEKIEGKLREIRLENLSYGYQEKLLFDKINLKLDTTKRTLLLGAVGSGKSTLIELVTGMLPADSGKVLVNDKLLEDIERHSFLEKLGYVPQEALLFSGSIAGNIRFAAENASETAYTKSLETAQIFSEISAMADKDATDLQQRGSNVSGGQKQRLTIARALIRQPDYLILDDITASLDAQNEKKLWEAMKVHYPQTGALVVSHRISTIQYAEEIIFIKGDGTVLQGRHGELLKDEEYGRFVAEVERGGD